MAKLFCSAGVESLCNWADVEGGVSTGGLEILGGIITCFGGNIVILDGGGDTSFVWGVYRLTLGGGGAV